AATGLERGLGHPIDKLGASIAMLPSAEQAQVAFAEVESFVGFWIRSSGDDALPQLLAKLRTEPASDPVDAVLQQVSGANLSAWNGRWMSYLEGVPRDLPPELSVGQEVPHESDLRRNMTLGNLLRRRAHPEAAATVLRRVQ